MLELSYDSILIFFLFLYFSPVIVFSLASAAGIFCPLLANTEYNMLEQSFV